MGAPKSFKIMFALIEKQVIEIHTLGGPCTCYISHTPSWEQVDNIDKIYLVKSRMGKELLNIHTSGGKNFICDIDKVRLFRSKESYEQKYQDWLSRVHVRDSEGLLD